MTHQSRRPRIIYAMLLIPLLVGAKNGKGCCKPKDPPDTGPVDTVIKVEQKLQVTGISPSTSAPEKAFTATISGGGFDDGATVTFKRSGGSEGFKAASISLQDENTLEVGVPAMAAGSYDVVVTNPDGTTATLRQGLTLKSSAGECTFVRVSFDFDKASLTGDAKSTLDGKVPCYQSTSSKITIEGHADERGTTEYNLALGERRAEQVKKYLGGQGVANSRLSTVSFGEERPAASGSDESAWSQNRRADLYAKE